MRIPVQTGTLDLDAGVHVRDGSREALRPMEIRLLRYLADRGGAPVPHDELLAEVWGYSPRVKTRTVRVTVSRLRSRIESDPAKPRHLITVAGAGYALRADGPVETEASRLVGRSRDLEALAWALARHRIVEIVGMGGIGKTAIARVFASSTQGCLWVEARGAETADQVEVATAASRGIPTEGLPRALAQASLVVLDEVEGIAGIEALIGAWSESAPILVTSRVRLGIEGAGTYELPPLSDASAETLLKTLWTRASLSVPPDVTPLVRAVAGIPLAIELSEAWAPLATPAALAERIGTDSLAGVLAQSLSLLDARQADALTSLAVCPDGAALTEASQLASLPDLLTLRRHSLLQRDGERLSLLAPVRDHVLGSVDSSGAAERHAEVFGRAAVQRIARYRTAEQREAGQWMVSEAANLRAALRHPTQSSDGRLGILRCLDTVGLMLGPPRLHEADLAESGGLDADGQAWHRIALGRRLREVGALEEAVEQGRVALDAATEPWKSEAADDLARSLVFCARLDEAREPAELALAVARTPEQKAVALRGLGKLARFGGAGDEAERLFAEALDLAESPGLQANLLSDLGEQLNNAQGRDLIDRALAIQDTLGDDRERAAALLRRGYLQPDSDARLRDYEDAHQLALEVGYLRVEVHAVLRLAGQAMESGRSEYEQVVTDALPRARQIGDPNLEAALLANRGHMRTDREAFALAEQDYRAALDLYETIGMPLYLGMGRAMGGMGAAVAGNHALARKRLLQARECWLQEPLGLVQVDDGLFFLDGRVQDGSEDAPWFRWALKGGERPSAPDPSESWTARQLFTGRLRPPTA